MRSFSNLGNFQTWDARIRAISNRWTLIVALALAAAVAGGETTYTVRDLGTLGGQHSRAYGLNEEGWVVGEAETEDGRLHAFLWTPTQGMTDLGTLGGEISRAYGVNDRGHVVGEAETADGRVQAFLWSADGGMTNLPLPAGMGESYAYANNNFGAMVGGGDVGEGSRALVWTVDGAGVPAELTHAASSLAQDINDVGDIAGQAEIGPSDNFVSRAFFLGHVGFFPNLAGETGELSSAALALNASGQAAGYAERGASTHAMRFDPGGGWTDLDTLDNVYSIAHDLNDAGDAVGLMVSSHEDEDRAFVATGGRMADLNELVETDQPWLLVEARAVNNAGQIAGYGLLQERERAFLLTPVKGPPLERPEVRLVEPAAGASFRDGDVLALAAEASARHGLRRVTFYANGVILGTATEEPYRIAWSNVPAGSYNLVAAAVDKRGRMQRSSRVPVRVRIAGPDRLAVALLDPEEGTVWDAGAPVLLRAEAAPGEADVVETVLTVDGIGVATSAAPTIQLDWQAPTSGLFTVEAIARDETGVCVTSPPARIQLSEPDAP